jgi:hypothetical protein
LFSLFPQPALAWEGQGSGEVEVRAAEFRILSYSIVPAEVSIGEKISASVTIENIGDEKRTFYGVLSFEDPDGNGETLPTESIIINPKTSGAIIFQWPVERILLGYYNVSLVILTEPYPAEIIPIPKAFRLTAESFHPYPNDIDKTWNVKKQGAEQIRIHFKKLEVAEGDKIVLYDGNDAKIDGFYGERNETDLWTQWVYGDTIKIRLVSDGSDTAFGFLIDKIEARRLPSYYDVRSQELKEWLNYGTSTSLITLSREQIIQNFEDIVEHTKVVKHSKEIAERFSAIDILESKAIEKALKEVFGESFSKIYSRLSGITDLLALVNYFRYMLSNSAKSEIFGIKLLTSTVNSYNHVNFIVVEVQPSLYDLWIVSSEYYIENPEFPKLSRMPNGDVYLHLMGRYDSLPKIFYEVGGY